MAEANPFAAAAPPAVGPQGNGLQYKADPARTDQLLRMEASPDGLPAELAEPIGRLRAAGMFPPPLNATPTTPTTTSTTLPPEGAMAQFVGRMNQAAPRTMGAIIGGARAATSPMLGGRAGGWPAAMLKGLGGAFVGGGGGELIEMAREQIGQKLGMPSAQQLRVQPGGGGGTLADFLTSILPTDVIANLLGTPQPTGEPTLQRVSNAGAEGMQNEVGQQFLGSIGRAVGGQSVARRTLREANPRELTLRTGAAARDLEGLVGNPQAVPIETRTLTKGASRGTSVGSSVGDSGSRVIRRGEDVTGSSASTISKSEPFPAGFTATEKASNATTRSTGETFTGSTRAATTNAERTAAREGETISTTMPPNVADANTNEIRSLLDRARYGEPDEALKAMREVTKRANIEPTAAMSSAEHYAELLTASKQHGHLPLWLMLGGAGGGGAIGKLVGGDIGGAALAAAAGTAAGKVASMAQQFHTAWQNPEVRSIFVNGMQDLFTNPNLSRGARMLGIQLLREYMGSDEPKGQPPAK